MLHGKVYCIMGPQGSGKGTQAQWLADRHGIMVITIGDLLRTEAQSGSDQGKKLASIMERGDLVPDELLFDILKINLMSIPDTATVMFDGFPRTVEQAVRLDAMTTVTKAIDVEVSEDVSLERIMNRRVCPKGHVYNVHSKPTQIADTCDFDGLPVTMRKDDTEEAVRHRLSLYEDVTIKVLRYYRDQGKLITIDGDASIETVARRIEDHIHFDHDDTKR